MSAHFELDNGRLLRLANAIAGKSGPPEADSAPFYLGVDIGTANVASVVLDRGGMPVDGEIVRANVVREGMVVDYFTAVQLVQRQVEALRLRLGADLLLAASAVPPGTEGGNGRVTRNILEAVGLEVVDVIDEPSAAALALDISDGAVVDVGGGTTGISVLEQGRVVYTADEPTGGFHLDLVIAGGLHITVEEAEARKCNPAMQKVLFPVIRPVFDKIISITRRHLAGHSPEAVYLVGGPTSFPGFRALMEQELGLPVHLPDFPLLVTPLGISLACRKLYTGRCSERRA